MVTVKCPKCGAEIKYIPCGLGVSIVDIEVIEVVTERGRTVQGYLRHKCPAAKGGENETV